MTRVWYEQGLAFSCTQCGHCCGGAPGYCWVNADEARALARRRRISEEQFLRQYTRVIPGRGRSLREQKNYDCIFFSQQQGCTVYEERPRQCRTWPFWRSNLANRDAWLTEAESCPGMNQGRQYSRDEIADILADDGIPG